MRKILLAAAMLLFSSTLFAQGGLTITNNTQCGIWVKMLAASTSSGDPFACQLNSYTFLVPASSTWTWCNVYDFQGTPGGCGMSGVGIYAPGWAFGSPIIPGVLDFQWTDVTFQWDICSDCRDGGEMSNSLACAGVIGTCWSAPQTWTSPPPSPMATCTIVHSAVWQPGSGCVILNGNLLIVFN